MLGVTLIGLCILIVAATKEIKSPLATGNILPLSVVILLFFLGATYVLGASRADMALLSWSFIVLLSLIPISALVFLFALGGGGGKEIYLVTGVLIAFICLSLILAVVGLIKGRETQG